MRRFSNILQLRLVLVLFFLALAVPTVILVRQAYSQLKWEAFYQYRNLAQELSARVNSRFTQLISTEESRAFADYAFLVVSGSPEANYLQPSPLARFPVESAIPGLIGYFQLDADGNFSTPLLPRSPSQAMNYGVAATQVPQRQQLERQIQRILSDNQLARPRLPSADERPELASSTARAALPAAVAQSPQPGRSQSAVEEFEQKAGVVYDEMAMSESTAAKSRTAASTVAEFAAQQFESRDDTDTQAASRARFERLKQEGDPVERRQKIDAQADYGRVEDLNLGSRYDDQQRQAAAAPALSLKRSVRKEQSAIPVVQASPSAVLADRDRTGVGSADATQIKITLFESEIDPFDFALMDSGHFLIYRATWRDGRRSIQGAIMEQQAFLQGVIEPMFRQTGLSRMSDLAVAYRGRVFSAFGGVSGPDYLSRDGARSSSDTGGGELLYQARLSAPFSDLELLFTINQLPAGRGATVIAWAAVILAIVLLGGLFLMYRLGLRQIALARQQQDFVSSVSHELKTPLTSIRMYSEILREGWADEQKRKSYYDFIFEESERLSRLIANVLQLARMNRNDIQLDPGTLPLSGLFERLRAKLSSQIESAGFVMSLDIDERIRDTLVKVDEDCFTQILINLVDNAIKFSSKAEIRKVDISARPGEHDTVVISVRDYGPGVPKSQMKKIFRLFYRSETELTRETVGTGIGLALVHQQVRAMGGKVDVVNRQPGAEFTFTLLQG